ncbi:MAG: ISNCY family transposase [Deltaproteobacteria bacterium]|nr:ISNCY family transposase [Deltaproteobacteria bacterium]
MRRKFHAQGSVFHVIPRSELGKQLEEASKILDANPEVLEAALRDLVGSARPDHGRQGMTAEQVLRCAVLKQSQGLTYEDLEFHLGDSQAFRAFARLNVNQFPAHSALQENISSIKESTWEAMHRILLGHARKEGVEDGRKARIDTTVVDANIHDPTDSSLLRDAVRVLTRYLLEGKELTPRPVYRFRDHRRVVKKRALTILNARKEEVRVRAYRDLLRYAELVRGYAVEAILELRSWKGPNVLDTMRAGALADRLERVVGLLDRVISQTERRVLRGEKVPASEKLISLFEDHADIIVKDRREVHYGHKICLTGGASNLVLDMRVEKGNPADSELFRPMLERHVQIHGSAPRQVSADGGFASKENLEWAKAQGVQDCCFAKRRGMAISDMVRSTWVYRKLKRFRAGIESSISALKRAFGMDRCTWSGWEHFQRYVWSIVVTHNLFTMARVRLAQQ